MATTEFEDQPVQDLDTQTQTEDMDMSDTEEGRKSSVRTRHDAPDQTSNIGKQDTVRMSIIANGTRKKGTFVVGESRCHASGAYWEYRLVDADGTLYKNGAWIREKDLRLEKKYGERS
ncbi:hypothetical protein K505DRAFT_365228 [Melanomma pulvis-pyrius CBS 109.77]|uniref:Uncharacterized protein n=1 Tax=Melanomma pulvis-pyrius CBS 109.77 TaxID=1314802 RepID=A0A6A6X0Z1_9PLEO|nr:hypothetical protein K505DRAFT_365228 [Melanomma pulvis-pyrius CBS 109.77]